MRKVPAYIWSFTKEICRIKGEAKTFSNAQEIRAYVKENKHLLSDTVDGYAVRKTEKAQPASRA